MPTIKIFFSLEFSFRIFQCGFTQPLKIAIILKGWQPSWLIRITDFFGNVMASSTATTFEIDEKDEENHWLTNKIVCSVPAHLDLAVVLGISIFIVMSNATR